MENDMGQQESKAWLLWGPGRQAHMGCWRTKEHRTAAQSKLSSLKHMHGSLHEQENDQIQQSRKISCLSGQLLTKLKQNRQYALKQTTPRGWGMSPLEGQNSSGQQLEQHHLTSIRSSPRRSLDQSIFLLLLSLEQDSPKSILQSHPIKFKFLRYV